jgi:hypothetical protein
MFSDEHADEITGGSMYGKALKCDVCGHTEMQPEWPNHSLGEEFPGWIRLGINQPILYGWMDQRENSPRSLLNDAFDCCSIGCAQDSLRTAIKMIPEETQAGE